MNNAGIGYLQELERVIGQRKAAAPEQSYTARLYAAGGSRIAQKLGEEAVELALASVQDDRQRMLSEAADLVYHLIVLLQYHDFTLADVATELSRRQR
ncbi:MAG: phosphoribosyl-ATP diphosphatase [Gammaproteobacteria bacterium]|nr:phosphoribosyl-ATP diphosphatase [Gammaproteobacteria bacterium]